MDLKLVKVLDNGHRVVVDSKKKQAAQCGANMSEVQFKHGSSLRKLGKQKRPDSCECKCVVNIRKSSAKNYSDFMKSGLPERVLFYQNGDWIDFPRNIVELIREEFGLKKAAIEVQSNGCHFMLDILYMIQVDLNTGSRKPIAWIDEAGSCFFPQLCSADVEMHEHHNSLLEKDEEFVGIKSNGTSEVKLCLQIEMNGLNSCGLDECVEESNTNAKRIKIKQKSGRNYLELGANDDSNKKHVRVEEEVDQVEKVVFETVDKDSVRKTFFEGMKPSFDVNVLDINKCSSNMMQTRWEIFQKQAELTQKNRGDPNICCAWLAATKDVLSSTVNYGLAHCRSKTNATYGLGVHLTSVKCAFTSANHCDVDENGVRHMVFCRVILGNVELVRPGSTQFHPSSVNFDNGVDDLQNPNHYIIWNMNMNTHIYPEYVVSFKMLHSEKGKGHGGVPEAAPLLDHLVKGQIGSFAVEPGKPPGSGSSNARTPKSPWMPFSMLFEAISPVVSPGEMNKLYVDYEEMRNKKLSRQAFIIKLRSIVGDELLKTLILGLQSKFPDKADCVPGSLIGKC